MCSAISYHLYFESDPRPRDVCVCVCCQWLAEVEQTQTSSIMYWILFGECMSWVCAHNSFSGWLHSSCPDKYDTHRLVVHVLLYIGRRVRVTGWTRLYLGRHISATLQRFSFSVRFCFSSMMMMVSAILIPYIRNYPNDMKTYRGSSTEREM